MLLGLFSIHREVLLLHICRVMLAKVPMAVGCTILQRSIIEPPKFKM